MTIDQLEMKLRQQNVTHLQDVEYATLEPNGQIGFTLKQEAQPVTQKDFQQLQQSLNQSTASQLEQINQQLSEVQNVLSQNNLFTEVDENAHQNPPPKHLH